MSNINYEELVKTNERLLYLLGFITPMISESNIPDEIKKWFYDAINNVVYKKEALPEVFKYVHIEDQDSIYDKERNE